MPDALRWTELGYWPANSKSSCLGFLIFLYGMDGGPNTRVPGMCSRLQQCSTDASEGKFEEVYS